MIRFSAEELVARYLTGVGYRAPAEEIFQTGLSWSMYPRQERPFGEEQADSQLPTPTTENNEQARLPQPTEFGGKQRGRALPDGHPIERDKELGGPFVCNVPDARSDSRDRSRTDVPIRSPGKPGEEYGSPAKMDYGYPTRRHFEGQLFPKRKQREQRQKAKRVSRRWYLRNRRNHLRRSKMRTRRLRLRPRFQRSLKLRRQYPRRFERLPGGYTDPAKRTKDWRERQKRQQIRASEEIEFFFGPDYRNAVLTHLDPDAYEVHFDLYEPSADPQDVASAPESCALPPLEFFSRATFEEEDDADRVADLLEKVFGLEIWVYDPLGMEDVFDSGAPEITEDDLQRLVGRQASSIWHTFRHEQNAPEKWDKSKDQRRDEARGEGVPRGTETTPTYPDAPVSWPSSMTRAPYRHDRSDRDPANDLDLGEVEEDPGSSKVIPWDSDDVTKMDFSIRKADTISQILRRTVPKVKERAKGYTSRITGFDKRRSTWFFQTGDYIQKVRAVPSHGSKASNVANMDILVSCSCPFWRWQGPEHWSKEHGYLYDRTHTKGTAEFPKIRDPKFKHGVCKHVVSVLNLIRNKKLKAGQSRLAGAKKLPDGSMVFQVPVESLRYLLDSDVSGETDKLRLEILNDSPARLKVDDLVGCYTQM